MIVLMRHLDDAIPFLNSLCFWLVHDITSTDKCIIFVCTLKHIKPAKCALCITKFNALAALTYSSHCYCTCACMLMQIACMHACMVMHYRNIILLIRTKFRIMHAHTDVACIIISCGDCMVIYSTVQWVECSVKHKVHKKYEKNEECAWGLQ